MLCSELSDKLEYSWSPPLYGRLIRFGPTTLCYIGDMENPEEILFVETDQTGRVTDAGAIPLDPAHLMMPTNTTGM